MGGEKLCLCSDKVKEFDVGWVFYYQTTRFLDVGSSDEMLVGAAPIFVSRFNGELAFVSYHRPLEESIFAYRACGDISAHRIPEVRLLRGIEGASAMQAIQAVRKFSTYGIEYAKELMNSNLSGHVEVVQLTSIEAAEALVLALAAAGFDAEIEYSVSRKPAIKAPLST